VSVQLPHSDAPAAGSVADETTLLESTSDPKSGVSAAEEPASRRPGVLLRTHRLVKEIEPWGILVAVVALLVAVAALWSHYRDAVEARRVQAWLLLMATAPGNSGKREALEYLNSEDGLVCSKSGCWLTLKPRAELVGIKLGAYYGEDESGNLRGGVFLRGVQLPSAKLAGADLQGAILDGADLSGADLKGAILDRADLSGADLEDAILDGADLGGADLTNVVGLTQEQLDEACGNASTNLPDDLTISPCQ